MSCRLKVQLASEYEAATVMFSGAVAELRRTIGISTNEEYDMLGRRATEDRLKCEQARLALEQHILEHRC